MKVLNSAAISCGESRAWKFLLERERYNGYWDGVFESHIAALL